jgi:hypothetical protein
MGTRKTNAGDVKKFTSVLKPFLGDMQFFEYDSCGKCDPKLLVRQKPIIQELLRVRGARCTPTAERQRVLIPSFKFQSFRF